MASEFCRMWLSCLYPGGEQASIYLVIWSAHGDSACLRDRKVTGADLGLDSGLVARGTPYVELAPRTAPGATWEQIGWAAVRSGRLAFWGRSSGGEEGATLGVALQLLDEPRKGIHLNTGRAKAHPRLFIHQWLRASPLFIPESYIPT